MFEIQTNTSVNTQIEIQTHVYTITTLHRVFHIYVYIYIVYMYIYASANCTSWKSKLHLFHIPLLLRCYISQIALWIKPSIFEQSKWLARKLIKQLLLMLLPRTLYNWKEQLLLNSGVCKHTRQLNIDQDTPRFQTSICQTSEENCTLNQDIS